MCDLRVDALGLVASLPLVSQQLGRWGFADAGLKRDTVASRRRFARPR